jgi:hypothetical protein
MALVCLSRGVWRVPPRGGLKPAPPHDKVLALPRSDSPRVCIESKGFSREIEGKFRR